MTPAFAGDPRVSTPPHSASTDDSPETRSVLQPQRQVRRTHSPEGTSVPDYPGSHAAAPGQPVASGQPATPGQPSGSGRSDVPSQPNDNLERMKMSLTSTTTSSLTGTTETTGTTTTHLSVCRQNSPRITRSPRSSSANPSFVSTSTRKRSTRRSSPRTRQKGCLMLDIQKWNATSHASGLRSS